MFITIDRRGAAGNDNPTVGGDVEEDVGALACPHRVDRAGARRASMRRRRREYRDAACTWISWWASRWCAAWPPRLGCTVRYRERSSDSCARPRPPVPRCVDVMVHQRTGAPTSSSGAVATASAWTAVEAPARCDDRARGGLGAVHARFAPSHELQCCQLREQGRRGIVHARELVPRATPDRVADGGRGVSVFIDGAAMPEAPQIIDHWPAVAGATAARCEGDCGCTTAWSGMQTRRRSRHDRLKTRGCRNAAGP